MPVKGYDIVAKNIRAFGGRFIPHVNKCMIHVSKLLDQAVTNNINQRCHSLYELARLNYPYNIDGPGLHHPQTYWVHIQSGQMMSAKISGIKEADISSGVLKSSAFAGVDAPIAPYVFYVFWGTSKMIPRDFLTPALNVAKEPALTYLHKNLRDFVFDFKPF